jgi:cation:H+ antiporter
VTSLDWAVVGVLGAVLMVRASRGAVRHAVRLGVALRLSPYALGLTVIALGTDLPEMVNSVVSSWLGHGDINVGDSIGSVVVQGSLVLGLIPFFIRGALAVQRREAMTLAATTILLLLFGLVLMRDGSISRVDALLLAAAGVGALVAQWRAVGTDPPAPPDDAPAAGLPRQVALAFGSLVLVGIGATALVNAVIEVAAAFAVPEYLVSFFVTALGTSLPELAVNLTALHRGQRELALAGVLGACLLDASVSLALGPALFPTTVTFALAWRGAAFAVVVMATAGLLLGMRRKHDRASGATLIALYLASSWAMLVSG